MRLKLQELYKACIKAQGLKQPKPNGYKKVNEVFYYQNLLFILKIIQTELISYHYNNFLASHFDIKKTCELLIWKNY